MPEIKHQFTGGKMNKDLDERLIPNGEYRDAMNIEVSTSEGSDVGTVQNILGNAKIDGFTIEELNERCIASIADEKNDVGYYFVAGGENYTSHDWGAAGESPAWGTYPEHNSALLDFERDMIIRFDGTSTTPVFVDPFLKTAICSKFLYDAGTGLITLNAGNNPFNVEAGDIITRIETLTTVYDDISIPILAGDTNYLDINESDVSNASLLAYILASTMNTGQQFRIVVDRRDSRVLKFDVVKDGLRSIDKLITGVNIIDNMLFWTDGFTEPKKINIDRSIQGTSNALMRTKLIVTDVPSLSPTSLIGCEEKHIVVIKKSPTSSLIVEVNDASILTTGIAPQLFAAYPGLVVGNISWATLPAQQGVINPGDIIVLEPVASNYLPPNKFKLKLKIRYASSSTPNAWSVEILYIDPFFIFGEDHNFSEIEERDTFKNKFPRFSYRYKYEDGEYSCFAPFTNVIFSPTLPFLYEPQKAYNLGMENSITKIILKNYIDGNTPLDVVQIDLLYKESNSPLVYLVSSIKPNNTSQGSHFWEESQLGYEVKPNMIKAVLPENQLLRPYDNVPRQANTQEIIANRIIYANYLQNYNIITPPLLDAYLVDRNICDISPSSKSLKSIRNYSLGISYLDKFNRQSPVFSSSESDVNIPILNSRDLNQMAVKPLTDAPEWATHFKVFVKETSNEYYNLSMDRVYEAKDGNIWMSFPSSDRNKVDEETFLILKKEVDTDSNIEETNRYKILAIENEAPDFIKTRLVFTAASGANPETFFDNPSKLPGVNKKEIQVNKGVWDAINMPMDTIKQPLSVVFATSSAGGVTTRTPHYDVVDLYKQEVPVTTPPTPSLYYELTLEETIKESFLQQLDPIPSPPPPIQDILQPSLTMKIYRKILENKPEFDGRFFVKISRDPLISDKVIPQIEASKELVQTVSLPFYYLNHTSSKTKAEWDTILKFGSGSTRSEWFIDSAYYRSGYNDEPDTSIWADGSTGQKRLNEEGMLRVWDGDDGSWQGQRWLAGYNNGIYEENGLFFIDLAYSQVGGDLFDFNDCDNYVADYVTFSTAGALMFAGYAQDLPLDVFSPDVPQNFWSQKLRDKFPDDDGDLDYWRVGNSSNPANVDQLEVVQKLVQGSKFKFGTDEVEYEILGVETKYFTNYKGSQDFKITPGAWNIPAYTALDAAEDCAGKRDMGRKQNRRTVYKIQIDLNPLDPLTSPFNPIGVGEADALNQGAMNFFEYATVDTDGQLQSTNPAIWETESKFDDGLDIYYEVDNAFPLEINGETNYTFAPVGSIITIQQPLAAIPILPPNTTVVGWNDNVVELSAPANDCDITQNMEVVISRPDGSCVTTTLVGGLVEPITPGPCDTSFFLRLNPDVSKKPISLSWYNCFSFGNGVESDRIRDDYNQVRIDKGPKASSTLDEPYKEEQRKYGLIYSGLYNSNSGVNNLNQFIQAEKITKDINPSYGSIQKLHARDTDLVTLCEDKCLRILASKDAVFNADGNTQLTATANVLGQTIPFSGEFGISKNPESFASESYRAYFSDKVRGVILRLSKDGITPISMFGMKDWFKDNLKLTGKVVGSYDDKKDEYNVTLEYSPTFNTVEMLQPVVGPIPIEIQSVLVP